MTVHVLALGYQPNWWPILKSGFMGNALIGGTIVALAAGLIGYFVVVRQSAFAAHALAHLGLPGATGAVLLGVPVVVGLGVFCVGGSLVIGLLGKRAADREVVTGTVLAMAIGLGLFFNSLATKSSSTMTNVCSATCSPSPTVNWLASRSCWCCWVSALASSTGLCCSARSMP
jgi:zinc/manganese transport system permease protein